jgi:hypothetical protein
MIIEILVLIFFLGASLYLAYQFRTCGYQMADLRGSNVSLVVDLEKTRNENKRLLAELQKTRDDLTLTREELEKTRAALNSCTDAINGGS